MRMLHRQYYMYNSHKNNFKYSIEIKFLMEGKSNKWLEEESNQWGDLIFHAKEKKIVSEIDKLLDDESFGLVISGFVFILIKIFQRVSSDMFSFVTWENDRLSNTSHSMCTNLTTCGAAGTYIPNLKGCYGELLDLQPKKEVSFMKEFGNFTEFAQNFVNKSPLNLLPPFFLKNTEERRVAPLLIEPNICKVRAAQNIENYQIPKTRTIEQP